MINPMKNRDNYFDLLSIPDSNYELDYAITTTYALNLQMILELGTSLFLKNNMDLSKENRSDLYLSELTKIKNKLIIFCEKGQIKKIDKRNSLFKYLEDSIQEVEINTLKYSVFHPKVWLIRYVKKDNKKDILYKLIVLSRNLSLDNFWEVQFETIGKIDNVDNNLNNDLINFIKYLSKNKNNKKIKQIISELKNVHFDISSEFKNIEFKVFGKGVDNNFSSAFDIIPSKINNAIIISPFITESIINKILKNVVEDGKLILITRKEYLNPNYANKSNLEIYTIIPDLIDYNNEDIDENILNFSYLQGLHAKMFYVEEGSKSYLYLGSLNFTENAFNNNIETMIKLEFSKSGRKNIDIINDLNLNEDNNNYHFFEKVDKEELLKIKVEEKEDNIDKNYKEIIKNISFTATYCDDKDNYNMIVIPCYKDKKEIYNDCFIKPYLVGDYKCITEGELIFKNNDIKNLSSLFLIKYKSIERVIKIDFDKKLPAARNCGIINEYIHNIDELCNVVLGILQSDYYSFNTNKSISKNNKNNSSIINNYNNGLPLFEEIIKACYNEQSSIEELKDLLKDYDISKSMEEDKEQIKTLREMIENIDMEMHDEK